MKNDIDRMHANPNIPDNIIRVRLRGSSPKDKAKIHALWDAMFTNNDEAEKYMLVGQLYLRGGGSTEFNGFPFSNMMAAKRIAASIKKYSMPWDGVTRP
jgi:hypothetical protein